MVYNNNAYQPDKDAGWGLIFRLNDLWVKADQKALTGNFDKWELVLDRIFNNLLYRNPVEVIKNDEGEITDVKISELDLKEWNIMKNKIREAKAKKRLSIIQRKFSLCNKYNEEHYQAIMFYDMWLRKFMQKHQLYLKETESNPSRALFGGAFK